MKTMIFYKRRMQLVDGEIQFVENDLKPLFAVSSTQDGQWFLNNDLTESFIPQTGASFPYPYDQEIYTIGRQLDTPPAGRIEIPELPADQNFSSIPINFIPMS